MEQKNHVGSDGLPDFLQSQTNLVLYTSFADS